jgi:uncharacterized protein
MNQSKDEARPVRPDHRVAAIDVLRGIALFGVLMVNLINEFRVSLFQQFLPSPADGTWLDHAVEATVSVGMELKAFALFSLLFGVGLAIQFERLSAHPRRLLLLVRRLLVLLGFGLVHLCFIWNGDILTEYALVGLLALPFLYVSNRILAIVAVMTLATYVVLPFLLSEAFFWPSNAWLQQHVQAATLVYADGTWAQIVRYNTGEIPVIAPLHLFVAPRTLALFFLGALAWRTSLLRQPERHHRLLIGSAILGLIFGFGMNALDAPEPSSAWHSLAPVVSVLITLGPVVLAIGYGAAIIVLHMFTRSPGTRQPMVAQTISIRAYGVAVANAHVWRLATMADRGSTASAKQARLDRTASGFFRERHLHIHRPYKSAGIGGCRLKNKRAL